MNLDVYNLSYDNGAVYALTDDGAVTVPAPFDPYCFIEEDDVVLQQLRRHDCWLAEEHPDGYLKIEAGNPGRIKDFADDHLGQVYESDVNFETSVMIDEDVGVVTPEPSDVLYFDIEVDDRGDFAEPGRAKDRVISIAAVDGGTGEEFFWDDGHERSLLRGFLNKAAEYRVLAGWNSEGYDYPYLENRCAEVLDESPDWRQWVKHDVMPLYDSLARPTETLSTKLDDTGMREFGEGKTEVTAGGGDLYELWETGDDRLETYNIQDADLVRRIDQKYDLVKVLHTICDVCNYPPGNAVYESYHGNVNFAIGQIVDAKILEVARRKGIPQPPRGDFEKPDDFPGGYVLDPEPGLYENVVVPDYSSMYPNIVRSWNFGRETWVPDDKLAQDSEGQWHVIDGEWAGCRAIKGETGGFVHPDDGERSVPAEAADELIDLRANASKILDKGVKAINNTLYGIFASDHERYFGPHSENITLIGQELTGIVEDIAGRGHEAIGNVVYGDSVPDFEPVVYRVNGKINVAPIAELYEAWDGGDAEVWSADEWSAIRDVVKKPTTKDIYRVVTKSGIVHVTEDHSLIRADGEEAKPAEVTEGDSLLHSPAAVPDAGEMPEAASYEPEDIESWLLGVFAGDGSAGVYNEGEQNQKAQWKVSKNDADLLERVGDALLEVHGADYRIRESYTDDGTFVTPVAGAYGSVIDLARQYREKCYTESGQKRVPVSVLNGRPEEVRSFVLGYAEADGEQTGEFHDIFKRASSKSHVLAQGVRLLLERLGMEMGANPRDNYGNEYLRFWSRNWSRGDETAVESIEQVDYDGDHVYDIDTADGSFAAGVGDIIVHNTDSVMINMDDPEWPVNTAYQIADDLEHQMKEWAVERGADPQYLGLDVDDVYNAFYIGDKKKRYFGHRIWKDDAPADDMKVRGFVARKHDVPKPVREFQRELMEAVLGGRDTGPIISEYKDRLFDGEWDEELATSKSLTQPVSEYDSSRTLPVHVRAAQAIREEFGKGSIRVGSKVGYIKYGHTTDKWTWVHEGELGRDLNVDHYSYLWDEKFRTAMEAIGVSEHDQAGLGDFM